MLSQTISVPVTFMVSDGIMPSNEGRGYVLSRLLRRAARHGRLLGIERQVLIKACVKRLLKVLRTDILNWMKREISLLKLSQKKKISLIRPLTRDLSILADMEQELEKSGKKVLGGADAFKLYDTYGFPVDLTKEILEEKNITIDEEGFTVAMNATAGKGT